MARLSTNRLFTKVSLIAASSPPLSLRQTASDAFGLVSVPATGTDVAGGEAVVLVDRSCIACRLSSGGLSLAFKRFLHWSLSVSAGTLSLREGSPFLLPLLPALGTWQSCSSSLSG